MVRLCVCYAWSYLFIMRYHYQKPHISSNLYNNIHIVDHPVYNRCTLFKIGNIGLSVIQQRYNISTKSTYWTEVDSWVADKIYMNESFLDFFNKFAAECTDDGLYATVTVRQIMWALRMKPLPRERWETVFDRKPI